MKMNISLNDLIDNLLKVYRRLNESTNNFSGKKREDLFQK